MIQFFAPDILSNNTLPESESSHCIRVLRHKKNDMIYVTDGKGSRYLCRIIEPHHSHTTLEIISKEEISMSRTQKITVAVAPTKSADRMEWMAEKCVELGIDEIVLLRCDRSERKILKPERLQKIMISAMKQSLGVRLPEVRETTSFKQYIQSVDPEVQKFFGYCSPEIPRREFVKEYQPGGDIIVMIGPEGDFSEEEVKTAISGGFIPVTFGDRRLRTETACVFAVSAIETLNQIKGA